MEDKRYATKDKITMYKGVIALYDREKRIVGYDKATLKKRQVRTYRKLCKNIADNKQELNAIVRGNREEIMNCLRADKRLLLAYRNLTIHEIIEHIQQDNFNLKKTLDRVMHKFKTKVRKLIYLKLDIAFYEDILAIITTCSAIENRSKLVTEKVQEVILKQEAALQVGITYREIIDCMKKDRVYFNGLLDGLENDLQQQSRSIFNTLELGQLAVEQWDDTKKEYYLMKNLAKEAILCTKRIIKRETISVKVPNEREIPPNCDCTFDLNLSEDIAKMKQLQDIFNKLQEATKTTNFHEVFTRMQKQKEQSVALRQLQEKLSDDKEELQNKVQHARYSLNYFIYMMQDENEEYTSEVDKLQEDINFKIRELLNPRKLLAVMNDLWAKLNFALTQIEIKCKSIRAPLQSKLKKVCWEMDSHDRHRSILQKFDVIYKKIELLVTKAEDISMEDLAPVYMINIKLEDKTLSRARVVETMTIDHDKVPTREDIKEASTNIAAKAMALEAEID